MPLNVKAAQITIPPIIDSLDTMLSQYDTTIQSIPTSVREARRIIKKLRKQNEPWFLIITPTIAVIEDTFLEDNIHKNTVRLTAIIKSSMAHNPFKKINEKSFANDLAPVRLSKNSILIKPLYLELLSTTDPYAAPRYDPLIQKTIRQTSDLAPALPLILEALRSNRNLIRTNLKE